MESVKSGNSGDRGKSRYRGAFRRASKARLRLGHLFVLLALFLAPAPDSVWLVAAGAALVLYGELMRIASAGQIRKNEELAAGGPYAFTRNPLYFGSLAMGAGVCVMSSYWAFYVLFSALFFPLYYLTIMGEEDFLIGKFGEKYNEYLNKAPRLVPGFKGLYPPFWFSGFSAKKVGLNREISTAFLMLVIVALFAVKWKYDLELEFW